jgi:hypothetical protein
MWSSLWGVEPRGQSTGYHSVLGDLTALDAEPLIGVPKAQQRHGYDENDAPIVGRGDDVPMFLLRPANGKIELRTPR